ncbi:MAG: hypothetical protein ACI8X5_000706 [Planctomycetota bacterium]|jgi:hypothetical protein
MRFATCRASLLTTLFTLVPVLAAAQVTTFFHEDFESGITDWIVPGQWHLISDAEVPCDGAAAPFPNGQFGARFGQQGSCVFGEAAAGLTQKTAMSIPSDMGPVTLKITSYDETECDSCGWDWRFIYVSSDNGVSWEFIGESGELGWHETELDLTQYAGMDIKLKFEFDAVDWHGNWGLGWLIDDIRVDVGECELSGNYCSTTVNSSSQSAEMTHSGTTSLAANDLVVGAHRLPPNKPGLMFYGPTQVEIPYGDGTLCSGAGGLGYFRLQPILNSGPTGFVELPLDYDLGVLGSGDGQITAGSTWNFQFWFRDQEGGPAGFSFSDGLEVHFCP